MAERGAPDALAVRPCPGLGKLVLRADEATAALAGAALGLALPPALNRVAGDAERRALRLGPDEHLLVLARDAVPDLVARLAAALAERHRAVVDVSARLQAVEIEGTASRDTLAAACPLDLHPRAFGPGQATRTLFGKAEIVLDCLAPDRFRLLANRSLLAYVRALLAEACREHVGQPQTPRLE